MQASLPKVFEYRSPDVSLAFCGRSILVPCFQIATPPTSNPGEKYPRVGRARRGGALKGARNLSS